MNKLFYPLIFSISASLSYSVNALECDEISKRLEKLIPDSVNDVNTVKRYLNHKSKSTQLSENFHIKKVADSVNDFTLKINSTACENALNHTHVHSTHSSNPDRPEQDEGDNTDLETHEHDPTRDCNYQGDGGAQLRANSREGQYAYLNPERSHKGFTANEVSKKDAENLSYRALTNFGVPREEIDFSRAETRELVLAAQALDTKGNLSGEAKKARAEVHVIFPRTVNDLPVWDSFGRTAVDSRAQIARMHINWPDFCIGAYSENVQLKGKKHLVKEIISTIKGAGSCSDVDAVGTKISYIPVENKQFSSNKEIPAQEYCYLPGIAVSIAGPEDNHKEEISLAGQLLTLPLIFQ